MEYTNIKLEIENGVATIRLNRPDALNALNTEMAEELSGAIADVAKNEGVKHWWYGARAEHSALAQISFFSNRRLTMPVN